MTDGVYKDFATTQIHAGSAPDPATGARQVPIYQTTAYVFRDADHAAALFGLQEVGYIYSRLTNPTIGALQARLAALEGGAGAVCCSSGHAAQIMALFPLMGPGKNIVASTRLYGGTITQFTQTFKRFGWSAKLIDTEDLAAVKGAIDENTRAIFCETIANPGGYISDLDALAKIADEAGIPLIVDNTTATPYLCRPIEHGATLVVHSLTKYMTGNGTVTGGAIIDSGKFDWSASDKFPSLSAPEPAYQGLNFHETFGPAAFTFHGIAIGLRDLGMTMNPQGAHYTLMGIETLSLRMEKHVANAQKIAAWLETHPAVKSVTYPGLASSPYKDRAVRITPKGPGALFTVQLKGGYDACMKFVAALKLFSHVANLGDARSLVIHSASTTHRQLTDEQQIAAGAAPDVVRLSIGIEGTEDLIADLDQALNAAG
ncbi:O-acetylhomoserine aminocarboxypropyltransferase/cysteine synthase family protein [Hyphomonas neptunium ATCC 15444]|uniref:O-acetylhomoserine aminocarboxypropyltransferase/cysteine synthase family protein n=2 Tax=Hyphomonas TaxID=85 RepID=Q0BY80_HYPNA|nr:MULTISPECIES: O-acetylhomoserine aminocarboxypropyltransferase/cysteine synthase family protein [Hyphomonas]ABI77932.1 O-acetylhomoserine aminocarboxypropyltransferase/cysteine synthase family protein [Hyphomonas neptunium ATCC 15444]KCZ88795.1 O-acetylhomoserine aminocarboxypropyltransferase/cysteine synthase family protein [Hyphomonas hirschiana VP5]